MPLPQHITTILAFDFGTKSIGVAVGQTITDTAGELSPIKAQEGIPDWDILNTLLREWCPDVIIVGLPFNMDDTENEMTRRARKFGNRLHGRFGVPLEFYDEKLTTREAKEEAHKRGHSGKNFNKSPVDSIAARLILESWWRDQPKLNNHTLRK